MRIKLIWWVLQKLCRGNSLGLFLVSPGYIGQVNIYFGQGGNVTADVNPSRVDIMGGGE